MGDARLREVERRWKETGAVEDESVYLLERLRSGLLDRQMIELALYLGHPACVLVVERCASDPMAPVFGRVRRLEAEVKAGRIVAADSEVRPARAALLLESLQGWGKPTCIRALVALGRGLCSTRASGLNAMIEAGEDWIVNVDRFVAALFRQRSPGVTGVGRDLAASLAYGIWASILTDQEYVGSSAGGCLKKHEELDLERVRGCLRDELVPWALDYSDAVRERVEARQRGSAGEG